MRDPSAESETSPGRSSSITSSGVTVAALVVVDIESMLSHERGYGHFDTTLGEVTSLRGIVCVGPDAGLIANVPAELSPSLPAVVAVPPVVRYVTDPNRCRG